MRSARWNLVVTPEFDQSVRIYIPAQGGKKGDLSPFCQSVGASLSQMGAVGQTQVTTAAQLSVEALGGACATMN